MALAYPKHLTSVASLANVLYQAPDFDAVKAEEEEKPPTSPEEVVKLMQRRVLMSDDNDKTRYFYHRADKQQYEKITSAKKVNVHQVWIALTQLPTAEDVQEAFDKFEQEKEEAQKCVDWIEQAKVQLAQQEEKEAEVEEPASDDDPTPRAPPRNPARAKAQARAAEDDTSDLLELFKNASSEAQLRRVLKMNQPSDWAKVLVWISDEQLAALWKRWGAVTKNMDFYECPIDPDREEPLYKDVDGGKVPSDMCLLRNINPFTCKVLIAEGNDFQPKDMLYLMHTVALEFFNDFGRLDAIGVATDFIAKDTVGYQPRNVRKGTWFHGGVGKASFVSAIQAKYGEDFKGLGAAKSNTKYHYISTVSHQKEGQDPFLYAYKGKDGSLEWISSFNKLMALWGKARVAHFAAYVSFSMQQSFKQEGGSHVRRPNESKLAVKMSQGWHRSFLDSYKVPSSGSIVKTSEVPDFLDPSEMTSASVSNTLTRKVDPRSTPKAMPTRQSQTGTSKASSSGKQSKDRPKAKDKTPTKANDQSDGEDDDGEWDLDVPQ